MDSYKSRTSTDIKVVRRQYLAQQIMEMAYLLGILSHQYVFHSTSIGESVAL